ncbi:MAG: 1,4-beta-xylanase, partial [Lentisphaerae bacterium]|nr:1,4-beta-xylanase [Lentisphaerota bacterium]
MRFTEEQAAAWQAKYGWLTGCNFVPSYAVNQIETWRKETYNA